MTTQTRRRFLATTALAGAAGILPRRASAAEGTLETTTVRITKDFAICVARTLVANGLAPQYDYALQTLNDISYSNWREYDAEDTLRFYALRMREAGLIKSTPQKIVAEHTDWRFLNELKHELKA
jgi:hypothetical protein